MNKSISGSSPLTRGTPVDELVATRDNRFIPAYAGNSLSTQSRKSSESVHPRLRGELLQTAILCNLNHGSSPLTRGTQADRSKNPFSRRFIPAYAGNSPVMGLQQISQCGSSPLTRGTRSHIRVVHEIVRFIPAYAGNSAALYALAHIRTVHPRLRGELMEMLGPSPTNTGSSPLTRGTRSALAS